MSKFDEIAFLDTEVGADKKIKRVGLKTANSARNIPSMDIAWSELKIANLQEIVEQILLEKPAFLCGHNFIDHDATFLKNSEFSQILANFMPDKIIDTLFLSMLLFPNHRTHKLEKPYKNEVNIENNPLQDCVATQALFEILDEKWEQTPLNLVQIWINLLSDDEHFNGFFAYKNLLANKFDDKICDEIYDEIQDKIVCSKEKFREILSANPHECAFVIAILFSDKKIAPSSVILHKYPNLPSVFKALNFDENSANIEEFSANEFEILSFKEFARNDANIFNSEKISQLDIIKAGLSERSFLAVLPTGGGKTLTFWLPALIKSTRFRALNVVISPLQALMKNHVDNFKIKNSNFCVRAISGYLSPSERINTLNEVENGVVDILYIAPEALRSRSIISALKRRVIDRFIIDEAHCFSAWGHDFRHDYYFIADMISELETSEFQDKIAVSCFTATAKPEVISDIKEYFSQKLELNLDEFIASTKRDDLKYSAIEVENESEKYRKLIEKLRQIFTQQKTPTIIYLPQNANGCKKLSENLSVDARLNKLNLVIEPFYAKIDDDIENGKRKGRNKSEILQDFIDNKVDIVIATTAFGMGIDKPDIGAVIHYEQSDSLESYLQESGRGARGSNMSAQCVVIYTRDEFNKLFATLNRNKLDFSEICAIVRCFKAAKYSKKKSFFISPKEIANNIGLEITKDYETTIKTGILELEKANLIRRKMDQYNIFASSILRNEDRNMEFIHKKLDPLKNLGNIFKSMILIMQNLISKSKVEPIDAWDLAEAANLSKGDIFEVLHILKEQGLIDDDADIGVAINKNVIQEFDNKIQKENKILEYLIDNEQFDLREIEDVDPRYSKEIIGSFYRLNKLSSRPVKFEVKIHKFKCYSQIDEKDILKKIIKTRQMICKKVLNFIVLHLDEKALECEVKTSELKREIDKDKKTPFTINALHHCLVYMHEILQQFKLQKGRLIYYKSYNIEKLDNFFIKSGRPYKREFYDESLAKYYERKSSNLHIQMRFLEFVKTDENLAQNFAIDYFTLKFDDFISKYKFDKKVIANPVSPDIQAKIFGDLNQSQREIIDDKDSDAIMVLAGPGSGKTKTLVHKIASLVTIERKKCAYFLMLAHSRTAVGEFRDRLYKLIGNLAYEMRIMTFHAFAFELLGRKFSDEKELEKVLINASEKLNSDEIKLPFIDTIVIDEYQDINEKSFNFICAIYNKISDECKIIAVGDDDQCINNFAGADPKYIANFGKYFSDNAKKFSSYNLLKNYRSSKNLVEFANLFRTKFNSRQKSENLLAHKLDNAQIYLVKGDNYIDDLCARILSDKADKIAILARENDEVATIFTALRQRDINAKFISDKDGFRLQNLDELIEFARLLENKNAKFDEVVDEFKTKFSRSKNLELALEIIEKFKQEFDLKSEFIQLEFSEYLAQISFEEFEKSNAKVTLSTMHKAKGKEFDSVYVIVRKRFLYERDEFEKRLHYVAITRAKSALCIYDNCDNFAEFEPKFDEVYHVNGELILDKIAMIMTLHDINLSAEFTQEILEQTSVFAGDECEICAKSNKQGYKILKDKEIIALVSSDFKDKINRKIEEGYALNPRAFVENVVIYKGFKAILCKITLEKMV